MMMMTAGQQQQKAEHRALMPPLPLEEAITPNNNHPETLSIPVKRAHQCSGVHPQLIQHIGVR